MSLALRVAAWRIASPAHAASVAINPHGVTSGCTPVRQATLNSDRGMSLKLTRFGGTITEVTAPDRRGRRAIVVLGFASHVPDSKNRPDAPSASVSSPMWPVTSTAVYRFGVGR